MDRSPRRCRPPRSCDTAVPVSQNGAARCLVGMPTSVKDPATEAFLTHRNLLFTASVSGRLRRIGSSDFVIQLVPIAHVFGLASVLLCAITAGAVEGGRSSMWPARTMATCSFTKQD